MRDPSTYTMGQWAWGRLPLYTLPRSYHVLFSPPANNIFPLHLGLHVGIRSCATHTCEHTHKHTRAPACCGTSHFSVHSCSSPP